MRQPSVRDLAPALRDAARSIAARLAERGARGWIVGGAVRDLALGAAPAEIDMATAARPEEVEACFEATTAVGRSFGTIVVRAPVPGKRIDVQVTTFRADQGSTDQRRPDRVVYGATLEEDAARRDFRINALFLDPLTDEFRDPEGGMEDLERGLLRCVGEPAERFREDGLRLLRMARFAGALGLSVEPSVLTAARAEAGALVGVSPERVLQELSACFAKPGSARAVVLMEQTGLLERALPGQRELGPWDQAEPAAGQAARLAALGRLPEAPGVALGLAVLYDPLQPPSRHPEAIEEALAALDLLRPSRSVRHAVAWLWAALEELAGLSELERGQDKLARARRIRYRRAQLWREGLTLARAWGSERGQDAALLQDLERFYAELSAEELHPEPLVKSGDLLYLGVKRGPLWGQLLDEAEELQLDGLLCTRDAAKSWLAARAVELADEAGGQLGGKRRRKKKESE